MKSKFVLFAVLMLATTSLMAQKKEVPSSQTLTKQVTRKAPAVQVELTTTEDQADQKTQERQLKENQAKSKAARAKRDAISAAVKKRLAHSKTKKPNNRKR